MNAAILKKISSVSILVAILILSPLVGFTSPAIDEKEGVMIDFGYYNVDWVEMTFLDDMSGMDALEVACSIAGYDLATSNGEVISVNGDANLISASWGMYVLSGTGSKKSWTPIQDPGSYKIGGEKIIAWARASDVKSMMPAIDATGHTYYSYAENGKNLQGNNLRVVSLAPSVTEIVVAVGGLNHLVGTDMYSNYPEELVNRQNSGEISFVGGYTDPNYELIMASLPDIVFMDGSVGEHISMADKLRKSGMNCVVLYETVDVSDLMKNIWIVSSALGLSKVGNEYNLDLNRTINSICSITEIYSDKVFISLSITDSPYTAGTNTYITSILNSIGATNVFDNGRTSWYMVDKEQIYLKQPDTIVVIYEGETILSDSQYREILRSMDRLWKDTPAFQNKKVIIFSGCAADLLSRPGARLGAAVELLGKSLDPDSFIERDYWDRVPKYFGDDYADYLKYQGGKLLT